LSWGAEYSMGPWAWFFSWSTINLATGLIDNPWLLFKCSRNEGIRFDSIGCANDFSTVWVS